MRPSCDKWLAVLGRLRIDRKGNPAPHTPLLLLTVIEMVEKGVITEPILPYSGELAFRFLVLWPIVAARRSQPPEIWMPFFHLKTSGIWTPLDSAGNETEERRRVASARIDPDFFACLQDTGFRQKLRLLLIDRYFSDSNERTALAEFADVRLGEAQALKDEVLRWRRPNEARRDPTDGALYRCHPILEIKV